jgi:hypothetical protein
MLHSGHLSRLEQGHQGDQPETLFPAVCIEYRNFHPVDYAVLIQQSLTLNYGTRMSSIDNAMLREIIAVEAGISRFRSTSNNWQDYLPFLRYIPFSSKNTSAEEFRLRRDGYMNKLLGQLKEEIKQGTDISCITGNILKDPEAKLNEGISLFTFPD